MALSRRVVDLTHRFHKITAIAKLPKIRFHDLRHTAATLLLAQGVHPRLVMETLGHSSISLTMNTCSHVIPAMRTEVADRMNPILGKAAPNQEGIPELVATPVATSTAVDLVQ
ncbi:MAG: tyrosine-type recombinase/integrase [Bryobacteraceae bacterium]|jgi:integrase